MVYGGGGEKDYYTYRYTVTTRMTPALRWAAMRAILNPGRRGGGGGEEGRWALHGRSSYLSDFNLW